MSIGLLHHDIHELIFNTLGTAFQVRYCTLCALFWLTSTRQPSPSTKETQRTEKQLMFFRYGETKHIISLVLCEGSIATPDYSLYLCLKCRQVLDTASVIELSITPFSEYYTLLLQKLSISSHWQKLSISSH